MSTEFNQAYGIVHSSEVMNHIDTYFPTLGKSVPKIFELLRKKLYPIFIKEENPRTFILEVWNKVHGDDSLKLPQVEGLQLYSNAFSSISSILSGVSGIETSQLQYNQNNVNQTLSFVKEMLSDWSSMKKAANQAMTQAGS